MHVKLTNHDPKKIHVMKVLREHLYIGLKEAREIAEAAPVKIFPKDRRGAKMDQAAMTALAAALCASGATAEVIETVTYRWEVCRENVDFFECNQRLAAGWEPFAVEAVTGASMITFRRMVALRPSAEEEGKFTRVPVPVRPPGGDQ